MDDFSGRINELFSNPENMERIRSIIGMLGTNNAGESKSPEQPAPAEAPAENRRPAENTHAADNINAANTLPFDPSMLMKMQKAFSLMNRDDPRVTLLLALKPNLSNERRKKVDEAVQLLRLLNLLPMLREELLS